MARKDVELVIRAKDEAAKAVNAVTAAINQLVDAQDGLKKSAGQSDSALGKLGAALGELDKSLKGATVGSQIARSLDNASKAADRLEKAVASTTGELADLEKRSNEAAAATEKLKTQATAAATSVEREAAALTRAKAAVADQSTVIRRATADRQKLIDAEARLGGQITEQQGKLDGAIQKYQRLGDEIAKTANPAKTLTNSFATAGEAVARQEAKLNDLRTTLGVVRNAIGQTENTIGRLTGEFSKMENVVNRQEAALAGTKQEYTELQAAVRSAAQNQKTLAAASEQAADSLEAQKAALDRSQSELAQLTAAAGKADAAMGELASGATAQLQRSFDQTRRAMLETRREWNQSEKAVRDLAGEMTKIGPPTREQAVAWNQATVAARAAKQEYLAQRDGLNRLSAILKETGGDVDVLRERMGRFAQVQGQTGTALARIRTEAGQSVAAYQKLAGSADQAANSVRRVGSGGGAPSPAPVNSLADAWRRVYGESRQALSMTQRLRGEVLSLIAAYGGLYGVINVLGQAVKAYQTLEAAQSRLNAVFRDNPAQGGQELDFIRRNADRLGISFGQLADEYTKWAAATKGTNLEGDKTRKIFISVAEAARVNKLSFEDLQGVFRALTQIASKGRVQLEELSGQLGDRLPGALQIMADGLGITTKELLEMTKEGEVTSDSLVGFAEELDRRYGSALAASLKTTTTALGQMQNAAYQALITFADAGFIEAFTDLIRDLTETMKSADFRAFITSLSQAISVLLKAIGLLVQNFQLVTAAATGFVAIRIIPFITALAGEYTKLRVVMAATAGSFATTGTAMRTAGSTAGVAAVAFGRLGLAFRALLSSTGIGLALTAISVAIGYWATQADAATEALVSHEKTVDAVKNAYDKASGSSAKFAEEVQKLSAAKVRADLVDLRKALDDIAKPKSILNPETILGKPNAMFSQLYADVNEATEAFNKGEIGLDDYRKRLDDLASTAGDNREWLDDFIRGNLDLAKGLDDARQRIAEAEAALKLIADPTDEAAKAVLGLKDAMNEGGTASEEGKTKLDTYTKSVTELKEMVPELAKELKALKELAAIDTAYKAAIDSAMSIGQATAAYEARQRALESYQARNTNFEAMYTAGRGTPQGAQMAELVRASEQVAKNLGVAAKDLLTAMSYETGGTFDPWKAGPTTQWGQHRGLIQWGEPQRAKYGVSADTSITDQVVAAGKYLEDAGVKAGDGLLQIYAAINAGNAKNINASDANNGGAPGTVLDKVSDQMEGHKARADALLATYAGITAEVDEQVKAQERATEEARKQDEATQKKLADNEFGLSQQELINQGKQREAEIEAAIREAKANDPNITQTEIDKIREQTGALFDLKNVRTEDNQKKQEANALMQQANALMQQRAALEAQAKAQLEAGDQTGAQTTLSELDAVKLKLDETIAKAREMWEAMGGAEAQAKLTTLDALGTKLDTAAMKAGNLQQKAQQNYLDWGRVADLFASGLANAFDRFAQAVANGEDVGEAAKEAFLQFAADFLRQIAQMIIQQAILNALRSFGLGGGGAGGIVGGLFHRGGVVGAGGGQTRRVDPSIFAGAMRYHDGGVAGLKPGEVPAILKKEEEVLTEDDPRNILNGGAGAAGAAGGRPQDIKVVNAIDSGSFIDAGLNSKLGERAILNFMRANALAVKNALG